MMALREVRSASDEPLYNIGVVTRLTGISMATLRAWERRYDFPNARRTAGGHRLYSERDIMRLRWVKERINEGMQTAHAINALRHQEQTGERVLVEKQTHEETDSEVFRDETNTESSGYPAQLVNRLVESLIQRNMRLAEDILGEALSVISLEDLILRVVTPVLQETGTLWEEGKISVATEHMITNYLRQRLLLWMVNSPPPRHAGPIVLACAPEEWHEGSLLILGALLRRRGWPVIYLGQAVPLDDLYDITLMLESALVVLVAMMEETVRNLFEFPEGLRAKIHKGQLKIGFGGKIFVNKPEHKEGVLGVYLGDTFDEGIRTIETLIST